MEPNQIQSKSHKKETRNHSKVVKSGVFVLSARSNVHCNVALFRQLKHWEKFNFSTTGNFQTSWCSNSANVCHYSWTFDTSHPARMIFGRNKFSWRTDPSHWYNDTCTTADFNFRISMNKQELSANESEPLIYIYSSWSSVEFLPLLSPPPPSTSSPPPSHSDGNQLRELGKKSTGYCDQRVTGKTEVTPVMFCSNYYYVQYQHHQYKPPPLPPPENVLMLWSCWSLVWNIQNKCAMPLLCCCRGCFWFFRKFYFLLPSLSWAVQGLTIPHFLAKRGEAILWNAQRA